MHELGIGSSGFNAHHGHARNPHHLKHFTGGSSSGSAALVAAGVVPLAIGLFATNIFPPQYISENTCCGTESNAVNRYLLRVCNLKSFAYIYDGGSYV